MASRVRASSKNIFHNIYMFFTDDDYFCNVIDIVLLRCVKIRNCCRKLKIYQFLFEEEIEADEL